MYFIVFYWQVSIYIFTKLPLALNSERQWIGRERYKKRAWSVVRDIDRAARRPLEGWKHGMIVLSSLISLPGTEGWHQFQASKLLEKVLVISILFQPNKGQAITGRAVSQFGVPGCVVALAGIGCSCRTSPNLGEMFHSWQDVRC